MERRTFLTLPAAVGLASFGESSEAAQVTNRTTSAKRLQKTTVFQAGQKLAKDRAVVAYDHAKLPHDRKVASRGVDTAQVPHVYVYYDRTTKKFLSAIDVKATLDAAKAYTLTSKLHSFNIKKSDQAKLTDLKSQIQLAFNATAPNPSGDLTWIFMNAISIFGPNGDNKDQLTKFLNAQGQSGVPLLSTPSVTVTKGKVNLQVTAYGQRKDGLWKQFLDGVASLLGDGATAAALTGFGIPALALDAFKFVDKAVSTIMQDQDLVTLWQSESLDFGISASTDEIFKMCPGIWIIVDYDYASATQILQDHTIELALGTFQLLNKSGKPVDANYLATELAFTPVG